MQKWCPEPLDREAVLNPSTESEFSAVRPSLPPGESGGIFEPDPGFGSRHSLWEILSDSEREELLEKARALVVPEFEERTVELSEQMTAEREALRASFDARFDIWTREFAAGQAAEREALASEAAVLAVALANKIIRDRAASDREMVVRTLETVLYKVQDQRGLTVILNPADALLVEADPDLRQRLRIAEVVSDRRIEQGGCRVRSGGREWDATIAGQMDALTAVVEEAVNEWNGARENHPVQGDGHASCLD